MPTPVKPVKITLFRAEGPKTLCSKTPEEFSGPDMLNQAQVRLNQWGITAPEQSQGYDKCDVCLHMNSGRIINYRFDLSREGTESPSGCTLAEIVGYFTHKLNQTH